VLHKLTYSLSKAVPVFLFNLLIYLKLVQISIKILSSILKLTHTANYAV